MKSVLNCCRPWCAIALGVLAFCAWSVPVNGSPDVVYSGCPDITNHGVVGGIRAYSLGSNTCNIGNQNLLWLDNGTPGLAMNMYRLHDGRLEQIGLSWVKTACCAGASPLCNMSCNGAGGSVLGAGCQDTYGSGWNAIQTNLSPRSGINPFTGSFPSIPSGTFNAISRRLQVVDTDLSAANFPGALYFVEGQYVASDEGLTGNANNNASHLRVTVAATGGNLTMTGGLVLGKPAIYAWSLHGLGVNMLDPSVNIKVVDVPSEGRFYVAAKVTDLGAGQWRYDYAAFNLNSDRAGYSFSVPIPIGTTVTNVGFHDTFYHSGEPFDNTDWSAVVCSTNVTWKSPQTFAENPNTNALRWGTMYNFWFEADRAPATGTATLGLFRPGTPESIAAAVAVPQGCGMAGDLNGDLTLNGGDITQFIDCMLNGASPGANCVCADMHPGCGINDQDVSAFVGALLP